MGSGRFPRRRKCPRDRAGRGSAGSGMEGGGGAPGSLGGFEDFILAAMAGAMPKIFRYFRVLISEISPFPAGDHGKGAATRLGPGLKFPGACASSWVPLRIFLIRRSSSQVPLHIFLTATEPPQNGNEGRECAGLMKFPRGGSVTRERFHDNFCPASRRYRVFPRRLAQSGAPRACISPA